MQTYRKLPGRRRGFLFGSSVWLGPDHLLLVKSSRFREEYRRFYFRDIQAIVAAEAPRFHISTRSAAIGALWGFLMAILYGGFRPYVWIGWAVLGALVLAWVYVSMYRGCRCRIYTAVSSEDLPSLYRDWNIAPFLAKVEPCIAQAQGTLEGDWSEAVEERQVGALPEGRQPSATPPKAVATDPSGAAARTPFSLLLVGSLVLGGIADLVALRASSGTARWILLGFILLQVAAAVGVVVESYRGRGRRAFRTLAIVVLVATGVWYYAVQVGAGMAIAYQSGRTKSPPPAVQFEPLGLLNYPASRGVAGGMELLLGLCGSALLARGERSA